MVIRTVLTVLAIAVAAALASDAPAGVGVEAKPSCSQSTYAAPPQAMVQQAPPVVVQTPPQTVTVPSQTYTVTTAPQTVTVPGQTLTVQGGPATYATVPPCQPLQIKTEIYRKSWLQSLRANRTRLLRREKHLGMAEETAPQASATDEAGAG